MTRTWRAKSSADDEPAPIQPSPRRAARRSAGSRPAPNQTGSPGRWIGLGSSRAREKRRSSPSNETSSPLHSARMTSTPSTRRRTVRSVGKPRAATCSSAGAPRPTPTVSRPPDRRSSDAISFASRTGWRRVITMTAMPSRTSRVTAAAYASTCRPSSSGVRDVGPPTALSSVHSPLNPSVSARAA